MSPHRRQVPQTGSPLKWTIQWLLVMLLSYGALIVALGWPFMFLHTIQPGDIADRDYISREKTSVVDIAKTREAQEAARAATVPVMRRNDAAREANIDRVMKIVEGPVIPDVMASLPDKNYAAWQKATEASARRFIEHVALYHDAEEKWGAIFHAFLPDSWSDDLRDKTSKLVAAQLQPDVELDQTATDQKFKEKMASVRPITKEIETGTLLIERGQQLTSDDVSMLNQMGIKDSREISNLLGIGVALLAAFALFGAFLFTYEPQLFFSPSALALMATVCVVTSGVASAVGRDYPQFLPLPACALILSVLFGRRVSAVLTLLIVLFLRVSDLVDPAHLIGLAAASGMALGINITKRKELMLTGLMIGVMQAIGYFVASIFFHPNTQAMPIAFELVRNLLGGLSSAIVGIGSLPFLEIMFGVLTPFRVAELSEPDQPLLRQLEEKAPGTYQHSLAVANLAEAGAKAIGADVNLVRAGAMYHDIGKMVQPRYFIENQLGDKNPHDEIPPEESRARVLAHVTNGLELARKYGLPRQVKDFIPEHQGTTVMAYFYHKACQRDGFENVKESDYRYPGPKPQCKETAIVMLADVSEAVTHSMRDPTQEEVEIAIGNVFKARWDDGQFSESNLTAAELEKVKQAFVRVWRTLHHERLKYPSTTTGRMPVPPNRPPVTGPVQERNPD
jgi:cyclic-di-AMP phosphodiesterase PgpH